jgi:acyl-homoserine-lactone acylase
MAPVDEMARWRATAARVRIVRDDWGIAHVHGQTDADAVFGMIYAQAEDDFPRVETNYLNALGRLAEAEGEKAVLQDLRMKLFVDPEDLRARFAASPPWLVALMRAWADGLDFFLATHPAVKPRVLTRFEPWMALSFTEGSIGGDIERISLRELGALYDAQAQTPAAAHATAASPAEERGGSNGFALAPARTAAGHALLLINPHTSFFFRSELQMTSDEGLDAYGAVTWGQLFVYQGWNAHAGWMHTSSGVDAVDEYLETITWKDGRPYARYGAEERAVLTRTLTVPFRRDAGGLATKTFTVHATHHGPVVRATKDGGRDRWVAVSLMQKPVEALSQSFLRTKAHDLASLLEASQLRANSSNNTIFADDKGEIAYLHPQFVPKRDDRFDFTRPVDGADPKTDWQGLHALEDLPRAMRPASGWVTNTNNWPYAAAGPSSPKREAFPRYMDTAGENYRGLHATSLLAKASGMTLDTLIAAAYDPHLPAFARLVPLLLAAYDGGPPDLRASLKEPIAVLRAWDCRWSLDSIATSLAVFWGEALIDDLTPGGDANAKRAAGAYEVLATKTTPAQKLRALARARDRLTSDFGTWRTPWGDINRLQRIDGALVQSFSDAAPSTPVPFTGAQWGSLASFVARAYDGTKRHYGTSGNSFVAVVEFGDTVRARAVTVGGESGDPSSTHFGDQGTRYSRGELREVYFYPAQRVGHTEREYHPGE